MSLEKGLANVKMKPGNATTLKQLQEAITKNGFTMKASHINVAGRIVTVNSQLRHQVTGSNDVLALFPETPQPTDLKAMTDKSVVVEGILNEAAKGKAPDSIQYHAISEDK